MPDAAATRLATNLEAFANPRKQSGGQTDAVGRLPYPRRLGEAFGDFLEAIDPQRLPLHGGDASTVVVTMDFDANPVMSPTSVRFGARRAGASPTRWACG